MSIAKSSILNMMNSIPDEIEVVESLYKMVKLEKSRASAKENGTLSTDEVREHFARKRKAGFVTA